MRSFILLSLALPLFVSPLLAQSSRSSDTPTRNLRVILAGNRPMPTFEKRGNKMVEVNPPLSVTPPTAFSFTKSSHAPRKSGNSGVHNDFSAWPNELVRIDKYKGPSTLELSIKRPLVETSKTGTPLSCKLGKSLNPLVLVHPESGSSGWNEPQTMLIDMSPESLPERSVVVANLSGIPIKVYLSNEGVMVPPNKNVTLRVSSKSKGSFRYRVDASNGKKLVTVSNSSYRLNKNSRIIMLALPGKKNKNDAFALPNLRMVSDTI